MAEVMNPRFPHWCRIIRKTVIDPMEDEEDFTPYVSKADDSGYDPMGGDDEDDVTDNLQTSSSSSLEGGDSGSSSEEESQATVIYEGECRSYKINTTSDKGEVVTSERGLALPLNQDGWDELGVIPMEGDEVVVIHGESFKEYGRVVDRNVATASFAGTHLTWRFNRN